MSELSPREQKIEVLLSWWTDVLEGWREGGRGADELGLKLMGRVYNHVSYRELERCLRRLRDTEPNLFWHVRERYECGRRTVLACPRCDRVAEIAAKHFDSLGNVSLRHKHGDVVFFVRRSVPAVSAAVRPEVVLEGVRWIAGEFRGEPFIPNEILKEKDAA